MSTPVYDINEGLWQLYLSDCQVTDMVPNIKDFLVWCEEEDYDLPEMYTGDWGDYNG